MFFIFKILKIKKTVFEKAIQTGPYFLFMHSMSLLPTSLPHHVCNFQYAFHKSYMYNLKL